MNDIQSKSERNDSKWAVMLGGAGILPFIALLFVIAIECIRHVYGQGSKLFQDLESASFSLAAAIVCAGLIACAVILLLRLRGARAGERAPELGSLVFGIVLVLIGTSLAAVTVASHEATTPPCAEKSASAGHEPTAEGALASAPAPRAGTTAH